MKVTPLGDRVLVKADGVESKTPSGIIIPDTAKEKTNTAIVVAIGSDEKILVSVDQKVMYEKYSGVPVRINGVDHLILRNAEIFAIMEE